MATTINITGIIVMLLTRLIECDENINTILLTLQNLRQTKMTIYNIIASLITCISLISLNDNKMKVSNFNPF